MDSLFEPERMDPILIEFGSSAYYDFLEARPSWGKYFALGHEVIFVDGEDVYKITTGPGGIEDLPEDFDSVDNMPETGNQQGNKLVSFLRSICTIPWLVGLVLLGWIWRR